MLRPWLGMLAILAALALTAHGTAQSVDAGSAPRQSVSTSPLTVDVVVLDRDGRPVDALTSDDFTVMVDGRPRRVAAVKHVSRGPGATEAAATVAARAAAVTAASEPVRNVLIVADQTLLQRGDEAAAVRAGAALLDRLGLLDRVAIVRVPTTARTPITLTADRPTAREDLRAVAGAIAGMKAAEEPGRLDQPARADEAGRAAAASGDPDKAAAADPQLQIAPNEVPASVSPDTQTRVRDSLGGLRDLLVAIARVPGRKAIVVFTAGLPRGWNELVRDADIRNLAAAASAARATVHVIGLRVNHADASLAPELSAFETLARYSGGVFAMLDKQVDRTIERIMPSLASCYVLSLEAADSDRDGKIRQLRVETTRRGLTVQAPAALVPNADPEDAVVALPPAPAAGSPTRAAPTSTPAPGAKTPTPAGAEWPRDTKATRDAQLAVVLSRAIDYVAGYQRAFSAVVAEETYIQTAGTRRVSLLSDLLLVRPANGETWVSFRDVFEVNGEKVRDRESRLNALFLAQPNVDESEQLRAIKAESARYNIGAIERNLNVPLYALRVLTPENRGRFRFSLGRTGQSAGVSVQRIEFEEATRPTIVVDGLTNANVPLRGEFAIDPLTGAIIESRFEAVHPNVNARYDVRYRRDPDLGLWVPEQMSETYLGLAATRIAEAQATYSKFRRFQVRVEEKVTIPK